MGQIGAANRVESSRVNSPLSSLRVLGDPATPKAAVAPRFRLTLRRIGVAAIIALAAYLAFVGLYVAHERAKLLHIVKQLGKIQGKHELLTQTNTALIHSVVSIQDMLNDPAAIAGDHIEVDFSPFRPNLARIRAEFPDACSHRLRTMVVCD